MEIIPLFSKPVSTTECNILSFIPYQSNVKFNLTALSAMPGPMLRSNQQYTSLCLSEIQMKYTIEHNTSKPNNIVLHVSVHQTPLLEKFTKHKSILNIQLH